MYSAVLIIPKHLPSGVYVQALVASETCDEWHDLHGLKGLAGSTQWASVLASLE